MYFFGKAEAIASKFSSKSPHFLLTSHLTWKGPFNPNHQPEIRIYIYFLVLHACIHLRSRGKGNLAFQKDTSNFGQINN